MDREQILELVQAGFSPELIELEFNVPIEKINKYIKQEEQRKENEAKIAEKKRLEDLKKQEEAKAKRKEELQRKQTNKSKYTPKNSNTPNKQSSHTNTLNILRKNYSKLTLTSSNSTIQDSYTEPTAEEKEKVTIAIEKIQAKFKTISSLSRRDKRVTLGDMLKDLKAISQIPKTIEQLTTLRLIFQSTELENLAISHDDKINLKLTRIRKSLSEELAKSIEHSANQTSNLEELLQLSKKLPLTYRGSESFFISGVKNRLDTRISQLRTAQTMNNIRNNVSPEIETVLTSIANNTFNLETARQIIENEAQRRVDTAPKNQFALTKDRHVKQVEIQIRTLIGEQGKKYPITNPGTAMNNLMILFSEKDKESALSKVVENLASQEKYDEAKELCSKYISRRSFDEEEPSISKRARQLHKSITFTQIGNMIVDQINKEPNQEDDEIFMKLLEERMEKERISPKQIIIGSTPSGSRKITLEEIWYTKTRAQK